MVRLFVNSRFTKARFDFLQTGKLRFFNKFRTPYLLQLVAPHSHRYPLPVGVLQHGLMLPASGRALRMAAVGRKLAFFSVRPRLLRFSTTSRDGGMLPTFDYSAAPMQSEVGKDALLAAAYEANSPEQLPSAQAETAAALPKSQQGLDPPPFLGGLPGSAGDPSAKSDAGATGAEGGDRGAVAARSVSPPIEGEEEEEYSADAAMASFIAQQGVMARLISQQQGGGDQSPPATPAAPQAAPAPRAEARAAAAPGVKQ